MEVLWRLERATVAEVAEDLPPPPLAYNSVLTTLRIWSKRATSRTRRRAAPSSTVRSLSATPQLEARSKNVVEKFFGNSTGALALRLIENERPSNEELARLRSLIERYEDA